MIASGGFISLRRGLLGFAHTAEILDKNNNINNLCLTREPI